MIPNNNAASSATIAVIDDSTESCMLMKRQLEHHNFRTICLRDGKEGLAWLEANPADLVILDLRLPDMDGFEVAHRIRTRYSANQLPILMVTANGHDALNRINGFKAGANDFMVKPYLVNDLLSRIHALLPPKS